MNIFKKIKTIEEVSDAFDSKFPPVNNDDIAIPDFNEIKKPGPKIDTADPVDIPNPLAAGDRLSPDTQNASNPNTANKALNLHPIENDELSTQSPKTRQLIHSIDAIDETAAQQGGNDTQDLTPAQDRQTALTSQEKDTLAQEKDRDISSVDISPTPLESKVESMPSFISGAPAPKINAPKFTSPKWPYLLLALLMCLWLVGSAATAYGYFELGLDRLSAEPIHALGFVGFVLIPACLLLIMMFMLRRMNSLSVESRKLAFLNEQLLSPSDFSAKSSAYLSEQITQQMDKIELRADQAFNRLKTVQTAFAAQIESTGEQLNMSAEQQNAFDARLTASKSEWSQSVKNADQSISSLSQTLDDVLSSFQARIQTTQDQMAQIGDMLKRQSQEAEIAVTPLFDRTGEFQSTIMSQVSAVGSLRNDMSANLEDLDEVITKQAEKLSAIQEQQNTLKSQTSELKTSWADDEDETQNRIFTQLTQIDALNERSDKLLDKLSQAFAEIEQHNVSAANLPLRGSLASTNITKTSADVAKNEPHPHIITATNPLEIPSFNAPKTRASETRASDSASLSHELVYDDPLLLGPNTQQSLLPLEPEQNSFPPQNLSNERILDIAPQPKKSNWLTRFGRQQHAVKQPSHEPPAPALPLNHDIASPPQQALHFTQPSMSLREALIAEKLSPDALIDAGCVRRAVQLRLNEGPFAMSRYVAAHLGAAVEHLRDILPHKPALKTQVHESAASFPLREKLDMRDEDALNFILNSDNGREYLVCDAALNG